MEFNTLEFFNKKLDLIVDSRLQSRKIIFENLGDDNSFKIHFWNINDKERVKNENTQSSNQKLFIIKSNPKNKSTFRRQENLIKLIKENSSSKIILILKEDEKQRNFWLDKGVEYCISENEIQKTLNILIKKIEVNYRKKLLEDVRQKQLNLQRKLIESFSKCKNNENLEDFYYDFVEIIREIGFDRVRFYQLSEDKGELIAQKSWGMPESFNKYKRKALGDFYFNDLQVEKRAKVYSLRERKEVPFDKNNSESYEEYFEWGCALIFSKSNAILGKLSFDKYLNKNKITKEELLLVETLCETISPFLSIFDQYKKLNDKLKFLSSEKVLYNETIRISAYLGQICKNVVEVFGASQGSFGLLSESREKVLIVSGSNFTGKETIEIPIKGILIEERLFSEGTPIVISCIEKSEELKGVKEILLSFGVKSILILPVFIDGNVCGSFSIDWFWEREISEEDIRTGLIYANLVSSAIKNITSGEGQFEFSLDDIGEVIIKISDFVDAKNIGIYEFLDEAPDSEGEFKLIAETTHKERINFSISGNQGVVGYLKKNPGLPYVHIENFDEWVQEKSVQPLFFPEGQVVEMLIKEKDRILGALYAEFSPENILDNLTVKKLVFFSEKIKNFFLIRQIENKRLESEQRRENLSVLSAFSQQVRNLEYQSELYNPILRFSSQLVKTNTALLISLDFADGKWKVISSLPSYDFKESFFNSGQILRAKETKEICLIDNPKIDSNFTNCEFFDNSSHIIVAPLASSTSCEEMLIFVYFKDKGDSLSLNKELRSSLKEFCSRSKEKLDFSKLKSKDIERLKKIELLQKTEEFVLKSNSLEEVVRCLLTVITLREGLGFNRAILFSIDENKTRIDVEYSIGQVSLKEADQIWSNPELSGSFNFEEFETRLLSGMLEETTLQKTIKNLKFFNTQTDLNFFSSFFFENKFEQYYKKIDDGKFLPKELREIISPMSEFLIVPIKMNGMFHKFLYVDNEFSRNLVDQNRIELLLVYCNTLALGINKVKSYKENENRNFINSTLNEISKLILQNNNPIEKNLDSICQRIFDCFKNLNQLIKVAEIRFIKISNGEISLLRMAFFPKDVPCNYQEFPDSYIDLTLTSGKRGICGRAISEGKVIICNDCSDEKSEYLPTYPGTKSEIAAPIYFSGEAFGVLNIESDFYSAFSYEDENFLNQMAFLISLAISKDKNYQLEKETFKNQKIAITFGAIAHEISSHSRLILANNYEIRNNLNKNSDLKIKDVSSRFDMIESESEAIKRIVEDFSFLAKSKENFLHEQLEKANLSEIVEFSINEVQKAFPKTKIEFYNRIREANTFLFCRRSLIEIVFKNLFSNSIKSFVERNENNHIIIEMLNDCIKKQFFVYVIDNGIGITCSEKIFEPYFTTASGNSLGLGLPIVKWIIESHRGFIKAEKNSTKGSTFIIEFPYDLIVP